MTKTDSTGSYAFVCDGTSAGSPVLTDGAALYTPGLSENRGGASRYYANDQRGNLWTIDASSKGQLDYQDTTGFGTLVAQAGSGSVFGYGGGNGCQTDADAGLVLMGYRYYDTRIGRFISQDPAGDGDNWYAYAGNSPTNNTDPTGLVIAGGTWDPSQAGIPYDPSNNVDSQYIQDNPGEYNFYVNGSYDGSKWMGATAFDQMNMSSMGPGFMMPAKGNVGDSRGQDGLNKLIQEAIDKLNKGGISKAERQATEKNIKALKQSLKTTRKADGDVKSRASAEDMEAPGERAARNAANAERRATLQQNMNNAAAQGAEDTELLEGADAVLEIDAGLIILGIIVK